MSSGSYRHYHHHHHPWLWWPQGCCLERSFTKSEKKIGQMSSGATGTVPSALRSGGQCALESPMSWLRVARTCPQSAARTTGRASNRTCGRRMAARPMACDLSKTRKINPWSCTVGIPTSRLPGLRRTLTRPGTPPGLRIVVAARVRESTRVRRAHASCKLFIFCC